MKKCLLITVFVMLGCASSKPEDVYVESIPKHVLDDDNRFDLDNKIYTINREILYKCSVERDDKVLDLNLKYIRMIIQGTTKPFSQFDPDYSQTVIKFDYLDENFDRIIWERTGLIENEKNIWLHPPRNGDLGILQLSAFPYIKLDKTRKWQWELHAAYANYQDVQLTHTYVKKKPITFTSHVGALSCIPVEATSESHIGTTTSRFLYHDKHGFVQLKFHTIEGTTITLDMMEL
jgi:hypothetical protein